MMFGAVVFVISSVFFLLTSFIAPLPPGSWIVKHIITTIMGTGYEGLVEGIINGVIYGVIIWFIFTIARTFYDKMQSPKEVVVKVEKGK
jgi:hypothetical protein